MIDFHPAFNIRPFASKNLDPKFTFLRAWISTFMWFSTVWPSTDRKRANSRAIQRRKLLDNTKYMKKQVFLTVTSWIVILMQSFVSLTKPNSQKAFRFEIPFFCRKKTQNESEANCLLVDYFCFVWPHWIFLLWQRSSSMHRQTKTIPKHTNIDFHKFFTWFDFRIWFSHKKCVWTNVSEQTTSPFYVSMIEGF